MSAEQHYRVGQVAALIGVSILTLHHYDGIGLLHPSMRLESGHRLYSSADLLKLQQILTLRNLGFELRQIRELLQRTDFDAIASLRIQRRVVRDRISEQERIEAGQIQTKSLPERSPALECRVQEQALARRKCQFARLCNRSKDCPQRIRRRPSARADSAMLQP